MYIRRDILDKALIPDLVLISFNRIQYYSSSTL